MGFIERKLEHSFNFLWQLKPCENNREREHCYNSMLEKKDFQPVTKGV